MAVRFKKIAEADVDGTRVTLRLIRSPDGAVLGRVSTLAFGTKGIELMSTAVDDPPIEVAIRLARDLAKFKGLDVDVLDPDNLWQSAWGPLR